MARSPLEHVVAHWSKLIEGLSASPFDFYDSVELAIKERWLRDIRIVRVTLSEGRAIEPGREYLRIIGERHVIDICAAQYGNGTFFSAWTTVRRPAFVLPFAIAFVAATGPVSKLFSATADWSIPTLDRFFGIGHWLSLVASPIFAVLLLMGLVSVAARQGALGLECTMMAVPLLGAVYERMFSPPTFYRYDKMQMLHTSVHAALLETLDGLLARKGLRALSEQDRRPVFKELLLGSPLPSTPQRRIPEIQAAKTASEPTSSEGVPQLVGT